MRKIFTIFLLFLFLSPFYVLAQDNKKKALYFYSENSDHCQEVEEYFQSNDIWNDFEIRKIEVAGPYNMDYLNEFFDVFGVSPEKRGWPVVLFDSEIIVGSQPIINNFLAKISAVDAREFPTPQKIKKALGSEESQLENDQQGGVSLWTFFGAALIDGVNPCSLGVMIIFLSFILLIKKEKRSLFLGFSFVLGVFIFYYLLGIFLVRFSWEILKFSKFFSLSASFILILMGFLKMRGLIIKIDKFNLLKVIRRESFWDKFRDNLKKILSHPGATLLAGFLTGYFLISCSYRPYLISAKSVYVGMNWKFFSYVLMYNIVFILPLVLLMALMLSGAKIKRIDRWENKNSRLINMIMGVVLLFVGVYLAQNWL